MLQFFIKDGIIQRHFIESGKVPTTIETEQGIITNPTVEQFKEIGWEEYYPPQSPEYIPTIEELTECKIRERYSINKEFQVQRKRDTDSNAFSEYNTYVEECITWAHAQPHRDE